MAVGKWCHLNAVEAGGTSFKIKDDMLQLGAPREGSVGQVGVHYGLQ